MTNNIPVKQNEERHLSQLRAAGFLYDRSKRIQKIQFATTVLLPVILSVLAVNYIPFRPYAALAGLLILSIDVVVFEEFQKKCKKKAALIQEQFDCELFDLQWNSFKVGSKPDWEDIHKYSNKYKKQRTQYPKEDWYSKLVGNVPLPIARIICQRTNLRWDADLRSNIYWGSLVIAGVLVVLSIFIGVVLNLSLADFVLSIATPLFPALIWLLKEARKHLDTITNLNRLKIQVENAWKQVKSGASDEILYNISRELQDEIFAHRHTNQPIFNFAYWFFRYNQEDEMNAGAEDLVKEIS